MLSTGCVGDILGVFNRRQHIIAIYPLKALRTHSEKNNIYDKLFFTLVKICLKEKLMARVGPELSIPVSS